MSTDAQRKAARVYKARRLAAGNTLMPIWLTPEDQSLLKAMRPHYTSNDAVFAAGLRALQKEMGRG